MIMIMSSSLLAQVSFRPLIFPLFSHVGQGLPKPRGIAPVDSPEHVLGGRPLVEPKVGVVLEATLTTG